MLRGLPDDLIRRRPLHRVRVAHRRDERAELEPEVPQAVRLIARDSVQRAARRDRDARGELVQVEAQRVDVGLLPEPVGVEVRRAQVALVALVVVEAAPGRLARGVLAPRRRHIALLGGVEAHEAEVAELERPAGGVLLDVDVVHLDVEVDDVADVQRAQRHADLEDELPEGRVAPHVLADGERAPHAAAAAVLHLHEERVALRPAVVVAHDVRAHPGARAQRVDLLEAPLAVCLAAELLGELLHGVVAALEHVVRLPHGPEVALPDLLDADVVAAELLAHVAVERRGAAVGRAGRLHAVAAVQRRGPRGVFELRPREAHRRVVGEAVRLGVGRGGGAEHGARGAVGQAAHRPRGREEALVVAAEVVLARPGRARGRGALARLGERRQDDALHGALVENALGQRTHARGRVAGEVGWFQGRRYHRGCCCWRIREELCQSEGREIVFR